MSSKWGDKTALLGKVLKVKGHCFMLGSQGSGWDWKYRNFCKNKLCIERVKKKNEWKKLR